MGKTYLLTHFAEGKRCLYFTATRQDSERRQVDRYAAAVRDQLGEEVADLAGGGFSEGEAALRFTVRIAAQQPLLVVLDEVPRLLAGRPDFADLLSAVWESRSGSHLAGSDRLGGVGDGADAGSAGLPASASESGATARSVPVCRRACVSARPRVLGLRGGLRGHVAATRCTCGAGSRTSRSPRIVASWRSRRVDCCCATPSTSSARTSTGVAATSGYWMRWGPARGGARGSRGGPSSGSTTRSTGCAVPVTSGRCVLTARRGQLIRCMRSRTVPVVLVHGAARGRRSRRGWAGCRPGALALLTTGAFSAWPADGPAAGGGNDSSTRRGRNCDTVSGGWPVCDGPGRILCAAPRSCLTTA